MPKMKTFRYYFHVEGSGYIDIQAVNQERADDSFTEMSDSELLENIEQTCFDVDDMEEIKQ